MKFTMGRGKKVADSLWCVHVENGENFIQKEKR